MSRALLVLANDAIRKRATDWIAKAVQGTRVTFQEPKRTIPQNSMLWALLADVSKQKQHCGRYYTSEEWKTLFLHALGQEMRFIPALDGASFVPIGHSSSNLSKAEMTDLIELILSWGAQNEVVFHDR